MGSLAFAPDAVPLLHDVSRALGDCYAFFFDDRCKSKKGLAIASASSLIIRKLSPAIHILIPGVPLGDLPKFSQDDISAELSVKTS